ncbi:hypothetical protein GCM10009665_55610 [Kitasatospora nipponensis]|uniref:Metallo-beta-lactamase domain-containing protein n=1 Tax=Kitasatospora nipponensis TaxID=258049 RepID=A0ABP4HCW6_9ACTN
MGQHAENAPGETVRPEFRTGRVRELANDGTVRVLAHLPGETETWGWANCGLIEHRGRALLVDTPYTPALTEGMLARYEERVPGVAIEAVALTHANGDHCWGLQALPGQPEVIATEATAHAICHEPSPEQVTALLRGSDPDSALGAYFRAMFPFDFSAVELGRANVTFRGEHVVKLGEGADGVEVHLIEVGPGHSSGDLLVHVPQAATVFAGDVLFVGHHPVTWASLTGVIAALDRVLALEPEVVVPGHGPVCGPAQVAELRDYLELLRLHAERCHAEGLGLLEAARSFPLPAYAAGWGMPERMVITIATHYRALSADQGAPDMVALVGACAEYWAQAGGRSQGDAERAAGGPVPLPEQRGAGADEAAQAGRG